MEHFRNGVIIETIGIIDSLIDFYTPTFVQNLGSLTFNTKK